MKIRFRGQLDWIQWDAISTGTNLYKTSDFPEKILGSYLLFIPHSVDFHGVLCNNHTIYPLMRLWN